MIFYDPAPIIVFSVDPLEFNISKVVALANCVDVIVFAANVAVTTPLLSPEIQVVVVVPS